jgi:hypothetical protein
VTTKPLAVAFIELHETLRSHAGEEILMQLILLLKPKRPVAVGNDAAATARRLAGIEEVVQVRHPSYGGQRDFLWQVSELYQFLRKLFRDKKPVQKNIVSGDMDIT